MDRVLNTETNREENVVVAVSWNKKLKSWTTDPTLKWADWTQHGEVNRVTDLTPYFENPGHDLWKIPVVNGDRDDVPVDKIGDGNESIKVVWERRPDAGVLNTMVWGVTDAAGGFRHQEPPLDPRIAGINLPQGIREIG